MYRRYCDQNKISKKRQMDLRTFQSWLVYEFLLGKKEKQTPKRDPPSIAANDKTVFCNCIVNK